MITLNEVEQSYPQHLRGFKRFILREYLQHKLLQIIYESDFANQLTFLGGTCLRIVHGNSRFSEDLDFDNFSITERAFEDISQLIKVRLEKEGYEAEIKTVFRGAYHCYIRFPDLLFQEGLSGYKQEKILIQLDTEPQHFNFSPEKYLLNRFDVFTPINITPLDLLLAQKFYSICNRKRNKGRDFYDVVFLLGKIKQPNYEYLMLKMDIDGPVALKDRILEHCKHLDMNEMARDVQPFLFDPSDVKKITYFPEYLQQVDLQ